MKKPVGRPKLELAESFSIRLGVEEDAYFREEADAAGVGVSVYIRMILTQHARNEMAKRRPPAQEQLPLKSPHRKAR